MPAVRFVLTVAAALALGIACAGKVDTQSEDAAVDSASDSALDADDLDTGPEPPPTATITPPSCPSYRPLKGIPCTTGLSCSYPCGEGHAYSLRATCPAGKWALENVSPCGG